MRVTPDLGLEAALVAFFLKEKEATLPEFYEHLRREVPPRERHRFMNALRRLREKGIVEPMFYIGHHMNYRISEYALERGIKHTTRRGYHGIRNHDDVP